MGKVGRQRTRNRARASMKEQVTLNQRQSVQAAVTSMDVAGDAAIVPEFKVPEPYQITDNPFKGTKIDLSALRTKLKGDDEEADRMSFISKGSISKGKEQMKKKDKMKMRHERWLEKVESIQQTKKRRKEKMKRLKTPVVGDLEPMMSALPELSEIMQLSRDAGKRADKRRQALGSQLKKNNLKAKQRQKLLKEERERFQKVLQHESFKSNPFETINRHLSLKIQQENESIES